MTQVPSWSNDTVVPPTMLQAAFVVVSATEKETGSPELLVACEIQCP